MSPNQSVATTNSVTSRVARLGVTAIALALVAGAMWFAWLGWDHEYYKVDGVSQGPYRAWQVIGCGVSIAVAAVLAYLWVRSVWAIFVLAAAAVIGFAVPWALDAASSEDSGLWLVGLVLLLVGGGIALVVLLTISAAAASLGLRLRSDH